MTRSAFVLWTCAASLLAGCGGTGTTPSLGNPLSTQSRVAYYGVLYSFCKDYMYCSDGGEPRGSVILDAKGTIYGTLSIGGGGAYCAYESTGCGAVFKLSSGGSKSNLYSFCAKPACQDGAIPAAALVFDARGSLYGTTTSGGDKNGGVVFKLIPYGSGYTESVLYSFCQAPNCADGQTPYAGMIFDTKGALYGTTKSGGKYGYGTVFKLARSGSGYTETVLYSFCSTPRCRDGANPVAGLVMDKNGALDGTTMSGGDKNNGVVFNLTRSRSRYTERVLYRFCPASNCKDGAHPQSGLIFDANGALYGTTSGGGFYEATGGGGRGGGTVFRLTPSGAGYKENVLFAFCCKLFDGPRGADPTGVIFDTKGKLYGATSIGGRYDQQGLGIGVIFKLIPSRSRYKERVLHDFNGFSDCHASSTPVFGSDATLYGTSLGCIPINYLEGGAVWELRLTQ